MPKNPEITLKKGIKALEIPVGSLMTLKKGTKLRITQALGGAFTVFTKTGHLARVDGKYAKELGQKPIEVGSKKTKKTKLSAKQVEELILKQLKTCYDPEIPVNIVDLGLVYKYKVDKIAPGEYQANVQMTLTMPGCGMGDVLTKEVELKALTVPGVNKAKVVLVMEPAWDQSRLSKAAKLELGL